MTATTAVAAAASLLLRIARSKIGGFIIRWTFAHMTALLPFNKLHETKLVLAFYHPQPAHNTHILIIPKRAIKSFTDLSEADLPVVNDIIMTAQHLVQELQLAAKGYRLLVNGGAYQDVKQIHFHLVSDHQVVQ
jgi:histidine triad (HIT) family protein